MRKSKAFEAGLRAVRDLKPDTFVVKITRPSKIGHNEAADKVRVAIFDGVDEFFDIEVK